MSMYRQLWLAIILSTFLTLLGGLLASTLNARSYLTEQLSLKNTDNATALALVLSQQNTNAVMMELTVSALFDGGNYELIRVVDPLGKIIVERATPPSAPSVPQWFVNALPVSARPGQAQISNGWQQRGTLTLVSTSRFAYQALWKSVLQLALVLTISGMVAGYLGTLILRRLREPLQRVINQASAISERRFVLIDVPDVPELRQLAMAMNGMVTRLKSMFNEEAERLETMRSQANSDALTGLPNQTFFLLQLLDSLESDEKVNGTLLLVRIADLTSINRQLGRPATDELLKASAGILAAHARAKGGLASRFKDGDFGMLLPPGTDPHLTAERLVRELEAAARQVNLHHLVVAVGVTRLQREQDIASLMADASRALNAAAAGGSSAVREGPASDVLQTSGNEQWRVQFESALSARRIRLSMQPVVDLRGRLVHQECLLELMFAEQGPWQQARRLQQIADQLQLTPRLDLAAISLGIEHLEKNPGTAGLAVAISVNSLLDAPFRHQLVALLEQHPGLAGRLSIQMPEEDAVKHLALFQEFCFQLKKTGASAGLQHVGRQLGDIRQLHDLGLDFLKVDSIYVRGLQYSPGNQAFLGGLSRIAHHIGTRVYAEGIVDPLEFAELEALGFDGASGSGVREAA